MSSVISIKIMLPPRRVSYIRLILMKFLLQRTYSARLRASRAFVLIELLLVLVVIAILAGGFFSKGGSSNNQSMYQTSMNRSKDAACKANRSVLRTNIEMFR